jgi:SH3-like domain-containing protein
MHTGMNRTDKAVTGLSIGRLMFSALAIIVAGGIVYAVSDTHQPTTLSVAEAAQGSDTQPGTQAGQETGFPLPRFVSLKAERVYVRRGPSSEHAVAWEFQRKNLPVEIVAESNLWRRIRDSDGAEGWVFHSLLSGRRTVIAAPWAKGESIDLLSSASASAAPVARVGSGAIGDLESCDGKYCQAKFGGYKGYVPQDRLFGVYPGEKYDN